MIGTGRVWATSAISAPSVITISTPSRSAAVDDRLGEGAPAQVRLDPAEQDQVALGASGTRTASSVFAGQSICARLALDQADRRPVDLEVVELLRVDPRDDLGVERGRDGLQRRASRRSRRRSSRRRRRRGPASEARAARLPRSAGPRLRAYRANQPARPPVASEPSGPRFTIGAWKRSGDLDRATVPTARDRRAAPRPAVRGPLRVRAQGPADGAQRRRLPRRSSCATAPARSPARVFREADRIGLRFERGDAVAVRGRVERFRGELVAELDDVAPARARAASTRPSSCPPPTARSRSSRASSST